MTTISPRILWLGNHRLLIRTELPRLRRLGFEVFHPPCRDTRDVHQSATTDWEEAATTLPPLVYQKLLATDFYSRRIAAEAFELLNRYFDTAIVTIEPSWLAELARRFEGKIIFRTYGHVDSMAERLWSHGAFRALTEREHFWYVPHAEENARLEHAWLRSAEVVVPYCVLDDVAEAQDSWAPDFRTPEIALSCPNILGNRSFARHYAEIKGFFNHPRFRIYGIQPKPSQDPQIVGTLPFRDLLQKYRRSAGFLYTYRDPKVCFLPPIEMMILGGPVLFLEGSLLDRCMPAGAPGRARDPLEAREKANRLLNGDAELAQRIIESQEEMRRRYLPAYVWPEFDRKFEEMLRGRLRARPSTAIVWARRESGPAARIVALAHEESLEPYFSLGRYSTTGPEAVRLACIVRPLLSGPAPPHLVLTCRAESIPLWHGFLMQCLPAGSFSLFPVDAELPPRPPSPFQPPPGGRRGGALERASRALIPRAMRPTIYRTIRRALRTWGLVSTRRKRLGTLHDLLRGATVVSLHARCEQVLREEPLIQLYNKSRSDADFERLLHSAQPRTARDAEPPPHQETLPHR